MSIINNENNRKDFLTKINQKLKDRKSKDNNELTLDIINKKKSSIGESKPKIINGKKRLYRDKSVVKTNNSDIVNFAPYNKFQQINAPGLFELDNTVNISIIIPMFKSKDSIARQISSWTLNEIKHEIIYVDDSCPDNSKLQVIESWNYFKKSQKLLGKIIQTNKNSGYGYACNLGSKHASGEILVFLNADTTVTDKWLEHLVEPLKDPSVGIVGNLQYNMNGEVDSAGSEWSWDTRSFKHIGKNEIPIDGKIPYNLLVQSERDMVTGCCFAIRADLFYDIEGFDTDYFIGYWEDSDLCMRVKSSGYKILYEPKSKIFHEIGHTKSYNHEFMKHNRDKFNSRWVETNRIDEFIKNKRNVIIPKPKDQIKEKVVGCVIACNEEEFLEASVNSIAPVVDEWIFVIGGNEFAHKAGMCKENGLPTDNTLEISKQLCNKFGGKVILPPNRLWKDKVEMRNAYSKYLKNDDWMFMLDGDEVYKESQLWRITELMKNYEAMVFQFWLFWNNFNTIGTDKWEQYPQERIIKWKHGYGYRNNHLHVSDHQGNLVINNVKTFKGDEKIFYHYSWIRPIEKIKQKLFYYKFQSGNNNDSYVEDVFLKWRENPESVIGRTHPMGGGSFKKFPGIHPDEVKTIMSEIIV